jgi:DNA-binding winged helix-turn-helix (wHTH) protein/tetratricopeptide (TPR) repeat protein
MSNPAAPFYEFGPFRVDVENRLLLRGGEPLSLAPKAVDTLLALVQHGGAVLKKDDLMKMVWPDTVIEEGNLTQNIYLLRKTLGAGADGRNYIETIPRRGYRFVGEVRQSTTANTTDLILAKPTQIQPFSNEQDAGHEVGTDRAVLSTSPYLAVSAPALRTLHLPLSRYGLLRHNRSSSSIFLFGAVVGLVLAALCYVTFLGKTKPAESKPVAVNSSQSVRSSADKFEDQRLTGSRDAYQAYLKGRYYWSKGTTPALEEAIRQFDEAQRFDPNYPLAYAGLAEAYVLLGSHYDTPEHNPVDAMSRAKAAAIKALQLNDALAEAHTAVGAVKQRYDWDWPGAEKEFKRAIALDPNDAHAHQEYSLCLSAMGRPDEAIAEIKRAQELDPISISIAEDLGDLFYRARDYNQALEKYQHALKLDPTDPLAVMVRRSIGWAYQQQGMYEQAVAEFIETSRVQNASPERLSAFRQAYDTGGMKGYWRKWLELQQDRIQRGRAKPFYLAQIYAFLGDNDQAFAYLQKAYEDRSMEIPDLRFGPDFDNLRADPRYTTLSRRLGLELTRPSG